MIYIGPGHNKTLLCIFVPFLADRFLDIPSSVPELIFRLEKFLGECKSPNYSLTCSIKTVK